ncbi:hypothetical protein DM02DRAFT_607931 [Periconia macrospinosa]|uniref:Uncharacterized protein n=1 Tax=Periconia macrospinosa TaxID=97972 RepID=A0A2V1EDW3_9PLEO|nr:hypothetical protein DM02DRAFT_607931 [Periconia macrospinosa]
MSNPICSSNRNSKSIFAFFLAQTFQLSLTSEKVHATQVPHLSSARTTSFPPPNVLPISIIFSPNQQLLRIILKL